MSRPRPTATVLPSLLCVLSLGLGGCEFDILGPGTWDLSGWGAPGGYTAPPRFAVTGSVYVGDDPVVAEEATVLLFAPFDTLRAVDSVTTQWGGYEIDLGTDFPSTACSYLARAVLWTGDVSELSPLVPNHDGGPCEGSSSPRRGADFRLPAYTTPLDEPFVVTGRILINGVPAHPDDAWARIMLRARGREGPGWSPRITPDAEGVYRFETTDMGERVWLCQEVQAEVWAGGTDHPSLTGAVRPACESGRTLPDVRRGTHKAAEGLVRAPDEQGNPWERVGAGEARLELLDPSDSTVVATTETLDDGSFHLWFPQDIEDPDCDWLVRATWLDQKQTLSLLTGGACQTPVHLTVGFDP